MYGFILNIYKPYYEIHDPQYLYIISNVNVFKVVGKILAISFLVWVKLVRSRCFLLIITI